MTAPVFLLLAAAVSLLFVGCTGGSKANNAPPPPSQFTIGVSVVNLVGTNGGLQLDDNGDDTLLVNANGSFTFAKTVADGSAYAVTISMPPTNPAQTCEVTNGTGTATANVTNVTVDCGHNEWTWMGGSTLTNQPGTYGTLGQPAPGNIPGGRGSADFWVDKSQNVWLFGGLNAGWTTAQGATVYVLNDLWQYGNGEWTWMGGQDNVGETNSEVEGSYGTPGTPSKTNNPPGTYRGVTWTDSAGNFWLFGGAGYNPAGTFVMLNVLWEYSNGEWAWMAGSTAGNTSGTYPTMPGARDGAASWIDSSGDVWVFGGSGFDSVGGGGELSDLWKYSAGQWTWMGGSKLVNQKGNYGNLGVTASSNMPGGRDLAMRWTDSSGNFWLFGGWGFDSTGTVGELNDFWKYSNGEWTWMGGTDLVNQPASYGFEGVPSTTNIPGGRDGGLTWTDTSGNLWLLGGETGGQNLSLNDLWKYSNGLWTWMGGTQLFDNAGSYGSLGTPDPSNFPGARVNSVRWVDAKGNLWLFGGGGKGGGAVKLNDLWMYRP